MGAKFRQVGDDLLLSFAGVDRFKFDPTGNLTLLNPAGKVLGSQMLVGRAHAEFTSQAVINGQIPVDNTIPQITEGFQVLSIPYTPKSATNRLKVTFETSMAADVNAGFTAALFVGPGNDAKRARALSMPTPSAAYELLVSWEGVAGTTSAINIQARVGTNGAANFWLNALSNAIPMFGGVLAATLTIEEFTPA